MKIEKIRNFLMVMILILVSGGCGTIQQSIIKEKVNSEKPDIKIVALGRNEEAVKSCGTEHIMKPIKSDELLEICR